MSLDSKSQLPSPIDSTDYPIWRRQLDGNRDLFTYGNSHPMPVISIPPFWNHAFSGPWSSFPSKTQKRTAATRARLSPELKRKLDFTTEELIDRKYQVFARLYERAKNT